ncbi:MAG TPA: bifunctional methylenetetrahydrofolate dehydrogenase/methenyltetrahydrofolate cyclohydrolase FolD [bacterium]|nr:bifunctional methylenetetrahydrofolate dehydrogenase/methenyltetrahydrofolate cyclohydrolase FolD [bacterium]
MPLILDGKAAAQAVRDGLKAEMEKLPPGSRPGLAVVLVGDNPASLVYVGMKKKACEALGYHSEEVKLPKETTQDQLAAVIDRLNRDPKVHGILVQLPLPKHLSTDRVIDAIDPRKDVDGLHPANLGKLLAGEKGLRPCTPLGVMTLLDHFRVPLAGKRAAVIGRSNLVGKPLGLLLLEADATVTLCHSKTAGLGDVLRQADLVVAAIGRPLFVKADMIKPGAVVVDVGTSKGGDGRLLGDVDYGPVSQVASAISPVPGGVGPMTIALLLRNTFQAFRDQTAP